MSPFVLTPHKTNTMTPRIEENKKITQKKGPSTPQGTSLKFRCDKKSSPQRQKTAVISGILTKRSEVKSFPKCQTWSKTELQYEPLFSTEIPWRPHDEFDFWFITLSIVANKGSENENQKWITTWVKEECDDRMIVLWHGSGDFVLSEFAPVRAILCELSPCFGHCGDSNS